MRMLTVIASLLLGGMAPAAAQQVDAVPSVALDTAPFAMRVGGLPTNTRVTVTATIVDAASPPRRWTSHATFLARTDGTIDTARDPSVGGSYKGIVRAGLACGLLPADPAAGDRLSRPSIGRDGRFVVELLASANGRQIAATTIERQLFSARLGEEAVDDGTVVGRYFEPPVGVARGLPVLIVGGSSGGINEISARILASLGHPALAQAYFNYPGTGRTDLVDIPIEMFNAGAKWLVKRSGADRVALLGISRGSEAVQLTAIHYPTIVAGVIAMVPSAFVHSAFGPNVDESRAGWTFDGQPIPYVRLGSSYLASRAAAKAPPGFAGSPFFLRQWSHPQAIRYAAIPLQRLRVPILALGATKDDVWPSALGTRQIDERLRLSHHTALAETHVYEGAGHGISLAAIHGWIPEAVPAPPRPRRIFTSSGGDFEGNCRAGYGALDAIQHFLDRIAIDRPASRATPRPPRTISSGK